MLLAGVLFALFMTGFWLYCLTDALMTPAPEFRGLGKPAWIAIIAVTFIGGALAWFMVRQSARRSSRAVTSVPRWDPGRLDGYPRNLRLTHEPDAVALPLADWTWATGPQQPASTGPDDDPEFLRALDRAIHGNRQADEEG